MNVHQIRPIPVAAIHYEIAEKKSGPVAGFSIAVNGSVVSSHMVTVESRDVMTAMILGEFVELWRGHQSGGMILYLADPGARSVLRGLAEEGVVPGLEVRDVVTGQRLLETWEVCRAQLVDMIMAARHANAPTNTHVVIATDASRRHRDKVTGLGVASSTGAVRLRTVEAATIVEGEFAAVRLALHCWKKAEHVDILTDSLTVYRRLNNHPSKVPESPSLRPLEAACVKTINGYRDQGKIINVHWVRSHNGHVLNDIADRAAVTARRCAQWDQPEMTGALSRQIRDDLREGLDGVTLHDLIPAGNDHDTRVAAA